MKSKRLDNYGDQVFHALKTVVGDSYKITEDIRLTRESGFNRQEEVDNNW